MAPALLVGVHPHGGAPDRLLQPPALLRAGAARRLRQELTPRRLNLVPHTHWDREWYLPFQVFRMRLVDLVDRVLDVMERDPRFVFTLDGQLATVDDYLEIRPEAEERIRVLVSAGRLALGPWQVLMDEFLVSGETIVRNLELGLSRGAELGGIMRVGYLPDMFGHIAQMPQLLRRAGIEDAAMWRGVPRHVDRHAFRWEAPDGSWVRGEYLVHGYWGAAHLLDVPGRLVEKVELLDEALRAFFGEEPVLAMYGTDHMEPLPNVADLVDELNASQDRYAVRLSTLERHVSEAAPAPEDLRWRGELRSGARANILMGVNSARIDLKAACARAEQALERYAEPLGALWGSWSNTNVRGRRGSTEPLLALAWRRLIENSAHDSICGCSADPVCAQVLVRYAEAEQIAGELTRRAVAAVAAAAPRGTFAVLNPSPSARAGLVELDATVPDGWTAVALELRDGSRVPTQELRRSGSLLWSHGIPGRDVAARMFNRVHGRELFGRWWSGIELDLDAPRVRFLLGDEEDPAWLDVDELKREIAAATDGAPDALWHVEVVAEPKRLLLASVPAPPLGWTAVRPVEGAGVGEQPVRAGDGSLTNGLVTVTAEEEGTFAVSGGGVTLSGVGRLVDGGDAGDTYNYAPAAEDVLVERPDAIATELRSGGPVLGELVVTRTYAWPLGLDWERGRRTAETASVSATTVAELRAGEPFVRFRVSWSNPSSDHRLRLHVPLPRPAASSFAQGQFCVVERGLEAEGGYGEVPLPTFPAHGFFSAGAASVLLEHLLEYELVDGGRELALTLLRSVGVVSRNVHAYRDDPAGPELPVPAAQLPGPASVGFALLPHAGSWAEAGTAAEAERYRHPFLAAPATGPAGIGPGSGTGLELEGRDVALTCLRRRGERLEVRLVCEADEPRRATLRGACALARAWETDLLGNPGRELSVAEGALELQLEPWEIRTVQLERTLL